MNRFLLANLLVVLISINGCEKKITAVGEQLQKERVKEEVIQKYLTSDANIAIYFLDKILDANTVVNIDDDLKVDFDSWFFFVDKGYPLVRGYRPSDYVFVSLNSGEIVSLAAYDIPINFSELDIIYPIKQSTEPLTLVEAFNMLMTQYLGANPKSAVFASNNLIEKNDTLYVSDHSEYYTFNYDSWFFFIDSRYITIDKWPSFCKYAFINSNTGFMQIYSDRLPPINLSELDTVFYEWESQNYIMPKLTFSDSKQQYGCRYILGYIENDDQNAIVVVEADEDSLSLNTEFKEFDLSEENAGLKVWVDFYFYLPPNYTRIEVNYCNDVSSHFRPPKKWYGKSGIVKIAVSDDDRATIVLENVHFFDENDENEVILESLLISKIHVRWTCC